MSDATAAAGVPVLLDTDLGSDVDDELALALLWGSPEVDLRGISTTYGDVGMRTAIVREMAAHVGRRVVVEPGRSGTRSGREVWWGGHEGRAYGPLPRVPVAEGDPSSGARMLAAQARGAHVLAIGPLGSVADALDLGLDGVEGIVVMGGDWSDPAVAEHNIASDVDAARAVLGSGLPVTAVGIDVTSRVRFGEAEVARFAACGHLGAILAVEMRAWMRRTGDDFEVPHDPLTALALLEPQHFAFTEPAAIEVADDGAVRRIDAPGTVRVATAVDVDAARRSMAGRIARGLGERAS